jgi:hypothetical protein
MLAGYAGRSLSRRTALELGSISLAVLLAARPTQAGAAELSRQREMVRRLFTDGVNAGDEALITALYAPILAGTDAGGSTPLAPAGMPIPLPTFRRVAPGVTASVDALVAEGDLVAALITWRGPHPPAGTHFEGHTIHLFHIAQAQIIEEWSAGWEWLEDRGVRKVCAPANPLVTP